MSGELVKEAYEELCGPCVRECSVIYSGKCRGMNANIRVSLKEIKIHASSNWQDVSPQIQKGLFQELMRRMFKVKKQTINIELYHHFIRSLPRVVPKTQNDPTLEESFMRVNEQMFGGLLEKPNLRWGKGINRLGTYEYATDLVTISTILQQVIELLDYVMYHELLHKKHQYRAGVQRTSHHSSKFKADEKKFPNAARLEKELENLVRKKKGARWFF